jgi:tRNA threonylcarbamoyladenosine biosynthesis protein TsaE
MTDCEYVIESGSVEETRSIGRRVGEALRGGEAIALVGGLGAGKTQLVKGIAAGAGVADPAVVTSPTFVLINEYGGRVYLYHVDAYRLAGVRQLEAIGIEEMFASGSVVIIEWADRVADVLPEDRLEIRLEVVGDQQRRIGLTATGAAASRLLAAVAEP